MSVQEFATPRVITVTPTDTLDKAMTLMEEFGIHHLVVVEGREIVGMLSDRDILRANGWRLSHERRVMGTSETIGPQRVGEVMSTAVECLDAGDGAVAAVNHMLRMRIHALPICQGETLIGIVTDSDILRRLHDLPRNHRGLGVLYLPLQEVMSTRICTVSMETNLFELLQLFHKRQCQHVPVMRNGTVRGMISDRDVRRVVGQQNVELDEYESDEAYLGNVLARDIMANKVLTAAPHETVRWAIEQMQYHRIHALPVVVNAELVGMVTSTDLLRVAATIEDL